MAFKKKGKEDGEIPVKIKVIFDRKIFFYQTGVDLSEEEFKEYHTRKDLKKQYDDITYFLNKANKIVQELGRNFSWKEFDALYYNRKFIITKINNQSGSVNIVTQIENYAKKLYEEGFIKTSKGYTTTANHLKGYLKKKDFNINDPQTSLHDPHFTDGKVPSSVAGSGKSPSLQSQNNLAPKEEEPHSDDYSFETGLAEAVASINSFTRTPQLPTLFEESSFYFLPKGNASTFTSNNRTFFDRLPANQAQAGAPPLDINLIKKDFPILQERVNGQPLIWLDNAATTQKPKQVIDRISYFYEHENSNIYRAAHDLAARATDAYEAAREKVRNFINAASLNQIVFVRGATEAINLIAKSWGEQYLQSGDEIILTHLEHHANIVPGNNWPQKKV